MRYIYLIIVALSLIPINCNAKGIARPIGGESRIKIVNYTPNTVYKFIGHYEYQSIIEFGLDEKIETIAMGTPTPWQMIPAVNRIFIKPVEDNATTNMTVITNKRMYFFEMMAAEAKGVQDEELNFVYKFIYPEEYSQQANAAIAQSSQSTYPDLNHPEKYNYTYSISGNAAEIEPTQVFDDGEFTYFKFKDINAELPAIFLVNNQGEEGLVNYRVSNGYVVIERVADRFTLRHGKDTICVFNESGKFSSKKTEKKFLFF
jgi:type IV secretion system protein VirB9